MDNSRVDVLGKRDLKQEKATASKRKAQLSWLCHASIGGNVSKELI